MCRLLSFPCEGCPGRLGGRRPTRHLGGSAVVDIVLLLPSLLLLLPLLLLLLPPLLL
jgi:hypothetical protein